MSTAEGATSKVPAVERRQTEKGAAYDKERKEAQLKVKWRQAKKVSDELGSCIATDMDPKDVKSIHQDWLTAYGDYIVARDVLFTILSEEERRVYDDWIEDKDIWITNLKVKTEEWFSRMARESKLVGEVSKASSRYIRTSRSVDVSRASKSSVAESIVKEEQKKAEIRARQEVLKERQKLEQEELRLKQLKEENGLKEEMSVAEARQQVLEEFDRKTSMASIEDLLENAPHNVEPTARATNPVVNDAVDHKDDGVLGTDQTTVQPSKTQDVVNCLRKPRLEIKSFSGDPTQFNQFVRQFKSRVEKICDVEECMSYLEQFTHGKAHRIVAGLAHLSADVGYPAAMKERFGDPEVVANAYVKQALSWSPIRNDDAKALDDFAIFLIEVEAATSCIDSLGILEYSENLKTIVSKLPYALHRSWRNEVFKLKGQGTRAGFKKLVEFIRTEAKKANDPVYGKNQLIPQNQPKVTPQKNRLSAASIESTMFGRCYLCSNQHRLADCPEIKQMSVNDRFDVLKKCGVCFLCFRRGHSKRRCSSNITCSTCKGRHNTLLHQQKIDYSAVTTPGNTIEVGNKCMMTQMKVECTLAVVAVKVSAGWKSLSCYAFIDPGSNVSFCSQRLLTELGWKGKKTTMSLDTMLDSQIVNTYMVNGLVVSDLDGVNNIRMPTVYGKEMLPVKVDHIPTNEDIQRWEHLSDINLQQLNNKSIDLLIGNNVPAANAPLDLRTGLEGSPYATKTLLGWIPWGVIREGDVHATSNFISVAKQEDCDALEKMYQKSLQLDFPERTIDDKREWSREDQAFIDLVSKESKLIENHYELPLPLKKDVKLPGNEDYARHRLQGLQRKLQNNPALKHDYVTFMEKIIASGYEEIAPQNNSKDHGVWYIPHHGVYHPKKKKLRVVFDCAARCRGIALNDVLMPGPNLLSSLHGVLIRFRLHEVAFISDIETMFYQVRVPTDQRDMLRFLWWRDGDMQAEPEHYRMTVHLFGAKSSPACANFALQKTARDNAHEHSDEAVSTVLNDFYMDDCLKSTETKGSALSLIHELKALCIKGGFNLTKWICNERDVLSQIPAGDRSKSVMDLDLEKDGLPAERALGVQWNIDEDSLSFKVGIFKEEPTRRNILSSVSSVYDPLGLIAPVTMLAKCILQEMCRVKVGWDEEASGECHQMWTSWRADIKQLENVKISRCYLPGKARVAPLKKITIPRMELTAATIAVKMCKMVGEQLKLKIDQNYYWTDSTAVLRYINNDNARFHTFVANRVHVIREATSPSQWKFVESSNNPADVASRGENPSKLMKSLWLKGPSFLWNTEDEWPEQIIPMQLDKSDSEVKAVYAIHLHHADVKAHPIDSLINYFSSWHKFKKAVAYIMKAKGWLLAKVRKASIKASMYLTATDLQDAETQIVQHIQSDVFADEIKALKINVKISRSSPVYKLDPVLNGMLRVGGRLGMADIAMEVKHPILIPKGSMVANLILQEIHEACGHSGRNIMLAKLREKFWIPAANSSARKIINRCVKCRKGYGKPLEQKMADLPAERVRAGEPPFTNIGMDFFGPLFVKQGRSSVKRYGVVFVCFSSKAIHIELACSLDTDACINAIRRCIARRGPIKNITCDNGTNLVGAQRELKREIDSWNLQHIHDSMLQRNINWSFNPPGGSHHGGIWERQIRSIRKILWAIANQQTLTEDTLSTFLCEVESILNNRPITSQQEDTSDMSVLTPNHILLLKGDVSLSPSVTNEQSYYKRRWRQAQYLADLFWRRWTREYLPSLQRRQKWVQPRRNVKIGDVVMVINEATPRNTWPMARVIEVFKNNDGFVRRVKVKTETSVLIRPIDKLCLLLENDG